MVCFRWFGAARVSTPAGFQEGDDYVFRQPLRPAGRAGSFHALMGRVGGVGKQRGKSCGTRWENWAMIQLLTAFSHIDTLHVMPARSAPPPRPGEKHMFYQPGTLPTARTARVSHLFALEKGCAVDAFHWGTVEHRIGSEPRTVCIFLATFNFHGQTTTTDPPSVIPAHDSCWGRWCVSCPFFFFPLWLGHFFYLILTVCTGWETRGT